MCVCECVCLLPFNCFPSNQRGHCQVADLLKAVISHLQSLPRLIHWCVILHLFFPSSFSVNSLPSLMGATSSPLRLCSFLAAWCLSTPSFFLFYLSLPFPHLTIKLSFLFCSAAAFFQSNKRWSRNGFDVIQIDQNTVQQRNVSFKCFLFFFFGLLHSKIIVRLCPDANVLSFAVVPSKKTKSSGPNGRWSRAVMLSLKAWSCFWSSVFMLLSNEIKSEAALLSFSVS